MSDRQVGLQYKQLYCCIWESSYTVYDEPWKWVTRHQWAMTNPIVSVICYTFVSFQWMNRLRCCPLIWPSLPSTVQCGHQKCLKNWSHYKHVSPSRKGSTPIAMHNRTSKGKSVQECIWQVSSTTDICTADDFKHRSHLTRQIFLTYHAPCMKTFHLRPLCPLSCLSICKGM